jgi:hypothetical protein
MFALIALELVSHPEQRAVDGDAIIASQFHDTGFDDEAAEFDEMPRALAALELPRAHVMSRPCGTQTRTLQLAGHGTDQLLLGMLALRCQLDSVASRVRQISIHFAKPKRIS